MDFYNDGTPQTSLFNFDLSFVKDEKEVGRDSKIDVECIRRAEYCGLSSSIEERRREQ